MGKREEDAAGAAGTGRALTAGPARWGRKTVSPVGPLRTGAHSPRPQRLGAWPVPSCWRVPGGSVRPTQLGLACGGPGAAAARGARSPASGKVVGALGCPAQLRLLFLREVPRSLSGFASAAPGWAGCDDAPARTGALGSGNSPFICLCAPLEGAVTLL